MPAMVAEFKEYISKQAFTELTHQETPIIIAMTIAYKNCLHQRWPYLSLA